MNSSVSYRFVFFIKILFSVLFYFYLVPACCGQENFSPRKPIIICHSFETPDLEAVGVASDNINGYLPFTKGNFGSLNLKTGEIFWHAELGGRFVSKPILEKTSTRDLYVATAILAEGKSNSVYNTGTSPSFLIYLRSLNSSTGLTNWVTPLENAQLPDQEIFLYEYLDRVLVVGKSGFAAAYAKISGKLLWNFFLESNLSAPPIFFNNKIILPLENKFLGILTNSGTAYFQHDISVKPASVFLIEDEILVWGDASGSVYALKLETKKSIWKFKNGAKISFINQAPGGLLLTSLDNFVYFVTTKKGKLLWKKRLSGRITIEPLIANDFVVVSSIGDSKVSVLDLSNGKIINLVDLGAENFQTVSPVLAGNILIVFTIKGIYTFSADRC